MQSRNDSFPFWLKILELAFAPWRAAGFQVKRDHTPKFDKLELTDYSELRHTIRNGDLLFCGGRFMFSKVIRYFSGRSKVSHIGIVYWWKDRLMLLECVEPDGVRTIPLSQYVNNYENTGKPYNGRLYLARDRRLTIAPSNNNADASQVGNPNLDKLLGKAATLLNSEGSYKDMVLFFWEGNTGRLKHHDDKQFICSEFVATCFKSIGLGYPDDGNGFIAPEHIAMSEQIDALVEIRPNSVGEPPARPLSAPLR